MNKLFSEEYLTALETLINKLIADELYANWQYKLGAYYLKGVARHSIEKEFLEHSEDEYKHFKDLLKRSQELDLKIDGNLDNLLKKSNCGLLIPSDNKTIIEFLNDNLQAEECAIIHYRNAIQLALDNKDYTTYDLFSDILEEEENHRFDIIQFINDLNMKYKLKF